MKGSISHCLRCETVELTPLSSPESIEFFECPKCFRHYARERGGALTFRWLHPVSLLLYTILFETDPLLCAAELATNFVGQHSLEELNLIVKEVQLELEHPTQNVREILGNPQTESQCRAFLDAFVQAVRKEIGSVQQ